MSEMEELLASAATLQRRGSTPTSDGGSQAAPTQELDLLGNPIVAHPANSSAYGYEVEIASVTVDVANKS